MFAIIRQLFVGFFLVACFVPHAYATPTFFGDTYSVMLGLSTSDASKFVPYFNTSASGDTIVTFDGTSEDLQAYNNGLIVQVNESEALLGGGINKVTIEVSANGDLFPLVSSDTTLVRPTFLLGLGADGMAVLDPLNPSEIPYDVLTLTEEFFDSAGQSLQKFVGDLSFLNPVDRPWASGALFTANLADMGVTKFVYTLEFAETSIPEPATLALFGLGLAGVPFVRRRKAA